MMSAVLERTVNDGDLGREIKRIELVPEPLTAPVTEPAYAPAEAPVEAPVKEPVPA